MSQNQPPFDYQQKMKELAEQYPDKQVDWKYEHNVSICERSKTVIEPLISEEFFLSYDNDFTHFTVDPHQPKYLIFDFDGVLADTSEANLGYWAKIWFNGDRELAKRQRDEYFDIPQHAKKHNLTLQELEERKNRSLESNRYMMEVGFELFEEFLEEIEKIPNAKLAIASSGSREIIIWPKIRGHRLSFTHVLGMEDHHSKEEKIALVCKDWGIEPKQAYYFTDTRSDVIELREYLDPGKIIGCPWGWCEPQRLQDVLPKHQILKNFQDIHRIFNRTNLKELSLKGIEEVNFYPADFVERGKNFINGIHDWCISRDLTWGHKMPVWYNLDINPERKFYSYQEWLRNPEIRRQFQISLEKPASEGNWARETKILDTWFSSSLWPLSTLGFADFVRPKKQTIIVGGGEVFRTQQGYLNFLQGLPLDIRAKNQNGWKRTLQANLTKQGMEVFYPQFPHPLNAKYAEWKIWFKKVLAQLDPEQELILVGHSLGGNFLLKYLTESPLPIKQLHLVASCLEAGDFAVTDDLANVLEYCEKIFLYHSREDDIVPFAEAEKLLSFLPRAELVEFAGRGHFNQSTFPELEEKIVYADYIKVWSKYVDLTLPQADRWAAHGIIYNPQLNKYLIAKINRERVNNLSVEAVYHLIGGKIEEGETIEQGFLRELEEESGLTAGDLRNVRYLGKVFHGFSLEIENYRRNVRLYSEMFYAETESTLEGFKDLDQESMWVSAEDLEGKILPEFLNLLRDTQQPNYFENQPKKTDFEEYYPTQTMVTAKEIFYIWIVRMITLGKYFIGRIPFEDLVITPTILDEKGRKMSKSLKNGLEPGEAIEKYSSDALRMAMMGGMIPGRNMRFGGNLADRLMENYRNFGNKVWNVARFLEMKSLEIPQESTPLEGSDHGFSFSGELTPASLWILSRFLELEAKLEANLEIYELAHSVDALYDFLWNSFADWYVEYLKTDESQVPFARSLFRQFIVALSPYLPFECEVLWKEFFGQEELLAFALNSPTWAKSIWDNHPNNQAGSEEFALVINFIQDLRSTRGLFAIDPARPVQVYTTSPLLMAYSQFVSVLARSELLEGQQEGLYFVQKPSYAYSLDILEYISDKQAEIERTGKVMANLEKQIMALEKQLANQNFLQNAEEEVVREKKEQLQARKLEFSQQQAKLKFLE